jgi:anti-sigma regulatory factor (Ser/Thr protein kinase)
MVASSLTRPVPLSPQPGVARRQLSGLLADAAWGVETDTVLLAVHEALVNAQRHGGGVTHAAAAFDGDRLVVEVRDRGRGFTVPVSPDMPDLVAETGRGLFLIRRLAADAEVSREGDEVCLLLRFER